MLKRMIEYLEMKWLTDGWKYVVALAIAIGVAYIAHPYVVLGLASISDTLYHYSWVILLLAAIGGVTVLGILGMAVQVMFTNPKLGKTNFNRNK